jgi:5,10-methenyltetrahydrofolate synthetase
MSNETSDDWPAVAAWRKGRRIELIERRAAVGLAQQRALSAAVDALLEASFPLLRRGVLAFCWPYRGEIDVRFAVHAFRERGTTAALPEVAGKGRPLQFRKWWPGAPMAAGVLGIPAPVGTDIVVPTAALVPVVGFDARGYRLGYGGGYFDRTLAAAAPRPLAIGVGAEASRLATIHPQPHDIPMDFIVTEAGVHAVRDGTLVALTPAAAAAHTAELATQRGLVGLD